MKIVPVSNQNFDGRIYLHNVRRFDFCTDSIEDLKALQRRIKPKPYNIFFSKDSFGAYSISVIDKNKNIIKFPPIAVHTYERPITRYLSNLMDLIDNAKNL